ncbi:RHS repeat-associated core domain-containing protein [Streptomyces sp. NPDC007088]|uniref:RHS repeat-associated core domain-containing protein n=1 Tax=Streptomyces sp. NPDC007088 TaxID=3364773 RepID=UPI0036B247F9
MRHIRSVRLLPGRTRRSRTRTLRRVAAVVGFTLVPGLLTPVSFAADDHGLGRPKLRAEKPQHVSPFTGKSDPKTRAAMREAAAAGRDATLRAQHDRAAGVRWPGAGSATVDLTGSAAPGALPVTLGAPKAAKGRKAARAAGSVEVKVLDQKATSRLGVKGVALTVTGPRDGGDAQLTVDYGTFASAYGGDWAGRLQLLRLPDCALRTPEAAECHRATPLDSTNERRDQKLTAPLSFGGAAPTTTGAAAGRTMVLALAAGTQSSGGDYKATPLAASSTWEAGSSAGTFTWSYPLNTPAPAAGPKPDLKISYDSGAVDGRTATTNNQGSLIGDGFDLTESYIERKYGSCDDDGQDGKYDLCWKYDNASLVLNGKATELVKDDTTGTWHLKNDDASTVTHSTGAENGDDNGEYWTVVTGDGATYVFGLNKLDGAGADDRTDSVWTVPVFGDDEGEPGYTDGSSFSGRDRKQAWRWNLDYVEDLHKNAMSYWYAAETNHYDKLGDDNTGTGYTRGGYLKEIRYGQRAGALFSASPAASDKLVLSYAERCTATGTGCDSLDKNHRDNWPDVPFDAVCKEGDKCTYNVSPSFFTRKRLTGVTSYAWDAAAATPGFAAVDGWTLKQQYLDPGDTGDTGDQSLWLAEIKHTGKRGADLSLDPVKFAHEFLPNRVDGGADDILPFNRPRLKTITSETGAQTVVDYLPADCVAGRPRPAVDKNTGRCYPVYRSPNGEKTPVLDWFQKYPVSAVRTTDPYGGSEAVQHTYSYSGGGAWAYNDDPMTPTKERTWSIWRGYERVTHLVGASDHTRSKTVSVFLRGMNGDRVLGPDGKTPAPDARRTAKVTGVKAAEITDSEVYAGFTREVVTYDGTSEVSSTVNDPWSLRTATQHKSYADTEAYFTRTGASHAYTVVTSKGAPSDRVRTTATTFDDLGMPVTVEDRGDDAVSGDEKCTRTWYARNAAAGISAPVSRTRIVARACSVKDADLDLPADSTRPGDVISDKATAFDTTIWSATQTPTKGDARWTGRAKGYGSDGSPVWQKTGTSEFDTLGRPTVLANTNGLVTSTTDYVPKAAGPLTSLTVTDAKKSKTVTVKDFARGADLKITDPNGKITETEYDSLGRITKVWLPNRSKALGKTPNYVYAYSMTASTLPWTSSATLKGDGSGYNTSFEIFDSLLRTRQVQAPSSAGGRIIAQTLYDSRGMAVTAQSDIWDNTSAPNGTLVQIDGGQAPMQTDTTFDGAGRAVKAVTKNYGVARWTVNTTYQGDMTSTSAPAGGQATAEVTNALGQTVERRDYDGTQPTGTYTSTKFTYAPGEQQKTVTGPDKAVWSYDYDLFGRQVKATDPDKGATVTAFDELDQAVKSTDSRNQVLLFSYDELSRKTGEWQTSKTDANKLAAWTFDSLAKGQQDTAVRYVGGTTGKAYTQKVTAYDALYKATGSQLILPADDPLVAAGVPSTLSYSTGYNLDGTVKQASAPAVAGLSAETVSYTYDDLGQVLTSKGTTGYLQAAAYSPLGDARQLTLATDPTAAKKIYVNHDYEAGTRRLTRSYVTDDVHGYMLQELKFAQDDAGNITSIFDATTMGGTGKADNQCFVYDGQRRLSQAWTPKTADCAASGRTTANLGGAAPYWTSYQYNDGGLRTQQTEHAAGGDTVTDYKYGTAKGQPHALSSTVTGGKTSDYGYDNTGNTTTRPGTQAAQTLTWDAEGALATASEPAADGRAATGTGYVYDASGELLIRRNTTANGETVLYLGATEVHLKTAGGTKTLSGSRSYKAGDQTVAVRTATAGISGSKLFFLAGDHHGTSSLVFDATTLACTKRYTSPFGAPRGTKVTSWPDDKGFLGKPADDTTGLTQLGARQYDPVTARFLSSDPVLEAQKPQSLNGYAYANNNPATFTDPTGLSYSDIFSAIGALIGGVIGAVITMVGAVLDAVGTGSGSSTGNTGGTAATSSFGTTGGSTNRWQPGATYNFITKSWDTPFMNRGGMSLQEMIAAMPDWGIVHDDKADNGWENRSLFIGWLWGGGYPLGEHQQFRGGDAFTSVLAVDGSVSKMRAKLLGQAMEQGMDAPAAKHSLFMGYQDRGPDPGSSFWHMNTARGIFNDVAGIATNGAIGTKNRADAFLGTWSGTAGIKSINKKTGTVTLKFHAYNTSDWQSATHAVPRSWNPRFADTFGAAVREDFNWEEKWPVGQCVNTSEWLE